MMTKWVNASVKQVENAWKTEKMSSLVAFKRKKKHHLCSKIPNLRYIYEIINSQSLFHVQMLTTDFR